MSEAINVEAAANEQAESSASPADNTRKARRAYARTECNIAIFSIAATLISLLAYLVYSLISGKNAEEFTTNEQYACSFLAMYGIAFPLYLLLSRPLEKAPPKPQKCSFGKLLLYFLITYSTSILFSLIGTIVTSLVVVLSGVNVSDYTVATTIIGDKSIIVTLAAVIGAPIIEELLMRKVFIDRVRKYGEIKAMIMSGILFGLLHGNFTQLFYTAPAGMALAYVYLRTGKVRNTMFIHFVMNFMGSVVPLILFRNADFNAYLEAAQSFDTAYLEAHIAEYIPMFIWCCFIIVVALGGVTTTIVLLANKKIHFDPPEAPIQKGKHFSVAILNYGMLILLASAVFEFVSSIL